jgi:hypothetical protein
VWPSPAPPRPSEAILAPPSPFLSMSTINSFLSLYALVFFNRLRPYCELALCSARKNGYMAYKKITIWQRRLLHTQPYTAS